MLPRLVVNVQRDQRQVFSVQAQFGITVPQTFNLADGGHLGGTGIKIKRQVDIGNGVIWRTIVMAILGLWQLRHKSFSRR